MLWLVFNLPSSGCASLNAALQVLSSFLQPQGCSVDVRQAGVVIALCVA